MSQPPPVGGEPKGQPQPRIKPSEQVGFLGTHQVTSEQEPHLEGKVPQKNLYAGGKIRFNAEPAKRGGWASFIQKLIQRFFSSLFGSKTEKKDADLDAFYLRSIKESFTEASLEPFDFEDGLKEKFSQSQAQLMQGNPREIMDLLIRIERRERAIAPLLNNEVTKETADGKKEILSKIRKEAEETRKSYKEGLQTKIEQALPQKKMNALGQRLDVGTLPEAFNKKITALSSNVSTELFGFTQEKSTIENEVNRIREEETRAQEKEDLSARNVKLKHREAALKEAMSAYEKKLEPDAKNTKELGELVQKKAQLDQQEKTKKTEGQIAKVQKQIQDLQKKIADEIQKKEKAHRAEGEALKTEKADIASGFKGIKELEAKLNTQHKKNEEKLAELQQKHDQIMSKIEDLEEIRKDISDIRKEFYTNSRPLFDAWLKDFVVDQFLTFQQQNPSSEEISQQWKEYVTSHKQELSAGFLKEFTGKGLLLPEEFKLEDVIQSLA